LIPKRLINEIEDWMINKKYGNIQINFSAGKIVNYNVTQSLRVEFHGDGFGSITAYATQPLKALNLDNGSGTP
jgi:hypothetical protein